MSRCLLDSVSQVMGLDDDYSREDIDETLKNHSQDIGVCYFHRQKVQFAWMDASKALSLVNIQLSQA